MADFDIHIVVTDPILRRRRKIRVLVKADDLSATK
jgi:hypothetical protein